MGHCSTMTMPIIPDDAFDILRKPRPAPFLVNQLNSVLGLTHSTPGEQCSSGHLLSLFHYHGGTHLVTDGHFKVKGTENLYISDASVTDGYTYGAPTTGVYLIGYAVADAIYSTNDSEESV